MHVRQIENDENFPTLDKGGRPWGTHRHLSFCKGASVKRRALVAVVALMVVAGVVSAEGGEKAKKAGDERRAGNPVIKGWYADPEAIVYGDQYWIFPTYSDEYGTKQAIDESKLTARQKLAINKQYLKQTFFDAFSSPDLVTWTKHPRVLEIGNVKWAEFALWAPSVIHANGKYYLFFAANDIQSDKEEGGIGVATAERPEGPYKDALGKPLVGEFHNGAQPIDPYVFRDEDGSYYLYYGGWKHCNVAKLRPDLLGLEAFADGTMFKEITPENYVEGPFVFRRGGKYLPDVVGRRLGRSELQRGVRDG